jgi:hypothetical protein
MDEEKRELVSVGSRDELTHTSFLRYKSILKDRGSSELSKYFD